MISDFVKVAVVDMVTEHASKIKHDLHKEDDLSEFIDNFHDILLIEVEKLRVIWHKANSPESHKEFNEWMGRL